MSEGEEQDRMPPEPARTSIFQPRSAPGSTRKLFHATESFDRLSQESFRFFNFVLEKALGERAARLRANKSALLAVMGFCGGAVGVMVAELVPTIPFASFRLTQIIATALWTAVATSLLTLALSVAVEYHLHKQELSRHALPKALLSGALAGAIAGGIAEALYGASSEVEYWRELLLRPACWGLMGAMLGWRLSAVLPNFGFFRGLAGGAMGGTLGGIGFLFTAILFPQFIGRMIGFGVLGAGLGVALVAADALFRDAVLEVHWAPNEITSLPLGSRPIYIGGGDDHVPIAGLPEHASSISFENGRVRYSDLVTNRKTDLKDGSKIKIGRVELVIRAKKASVNRESLSR
jgi:hypothetical protein